MSGQGAVSVPIPPIPWSEVVFEYRDSITEDSTDTYRLKASRLMVDKLTKTLTDNTETDVTTEQCVSAISALLRVTLDSKHTAPNHQEFLSSQEVVTLVHAMVTVTGSVDYIIQAAILAIQGNGVGFKFFIQYIANLLTSWIDLKSGPLKVKPGFICSLMSLMFHCMNRQEEACGNVSFMVSILDKALLTLVTAALGSETTESINTGGEYSYTALHVSVGTYRLLSVTRELLKHPGIDVNVRDCAGCTPLVYLVWVGHELGRSHIDICSILLSHPNIDVSICDDECKSVVDLLCHHVTKPESDTSVALQMIKQVCQHKTVTTNMTQTAFYKLLSVDILGDKTILSEVTTTLQSIIACSMFSAESCEVYNDQTAIDLLLDAEFDDVHETSFRITILKKMLELSDCTNMDCNQVFLVLNRIGKTRNKKTNQEINEIIQILIDKELLQINAWIEEESTAAHLAAKAGNIQLTELIISQPRFDPNTVDGLGNTVLFYICEYYPQHLAKGQITSGNIAWDFKSRNGIGQTVYDYYGKTTSRDPYIYELLGQKCGIQTAPIMRKYYYVSLIIGLNKLRTIRQTTRH